MALFFSWTENMPLPLAGWTSRGFCFLWETKMTEDDANPGACFLPDLDAL